MKLDRHLRHEGPFCKQPAYLLTGSINRFAAQALALTSSAFETGLRSTRYLLSLKRGPGQSDRCLDVSHLAQLRVLVNPRIVIEPALPEAHDPHAVAVRLGLAPVSSSVYSRKISNSRATASSRNCRTWLATVWRPSSVDTRAYRAAFTDTSFEKVCRLAMQEVCHKRSFLPTRTLFQYKMSLKGEFDSNTR